VNLYLGISTASTVPVQIGYALDLTNTSAALGSDFKGRSSGTVTILPGQTYASIQIEVANQQPFGLFIDVKSIRYKITDVKGATLGDITTSEIDVASVSGGRALIKSLLTASQILGARIAAKLTRNPSALTLNQVNATSVLLEQFLGEADKLNAIYGDDPEFASTYTNMQESIGALLRGLRADAVALTIQGYTAAIEAQIPYLKDTLASVRAANKSVSSVLAGLRRFVPFADVSRVLSEGEGNDSNARTVLKSLPGNLSSLDHTIADLATSVGPPGEAPAVSEALLEFANASGSYLELYQALADADYGLNAKLHLLVSLVK
jgi:hypothetical protein